MSLTALRAILLRDLDAVDRQVRAYPDDATLWESSQGISNPAGTLVLHLAGNLRHFIGGVLGDTGFVRDREGEFSRRDIGREALLAELAAARAEVDRTLERLSPEDLERPYPVALGDRTVRTGDFLLHLATHLAYHLGQIDYHRRLLVPGAESVGGVSIRGLPEMSGDGEI